LNEFLVASNYESIDKEKKKKENERKNREERHEMRPCMWVMHDCLVIGESQTRRINRE
jgi:hypothetical protein